MGKGNKVTIETWIKIVVSILVILIACELGFIVYIRQLNISRQKKIRETALEIAYEDSVNRANKLTHPKEETVAEHFNLKQEKDPLDDYIDNMVEKEIRELESSEQASKADSVSVIAADPELDENEDWGNGEMKDSVESTVNE